MKRKCTFKKKDELYHSLVPFGKNPLNIFSEKEQLLPYFEIKTAEINRDINQLIVETEGLKRKIERLEGHAYFVPHDSLLKVKKILEDNGLFISLGSEWLSEQEISEDNKKSYLTAHPLLPYSLLVEEPQMVLLKKALNKIKGKILDIPLIFQVKNKLDMSRNNEEILFHSVNEDGTFVYQTLGVELFTSRNEIERMIYELREKLNTKQESLLHLRKELNRYQSSFGLAKSFYSTYSETFFPSLEKKIEQNILALKDCDFKMEDINQKRNELESVEKQTHLEKDDVEIKNKKLNLIFTIWNHL